MCQKKKKKVKKVNLAFAIELQSHCSTLAPKSPSERIKHILEWKIKKGDNEIERPVYWSIIGKALLGKRKKI